MTRATKVQSDHRKPPGLRARAVCIIFAVLRPQVYLKNILVEILGNQWNLINEEIMIFNDVLVAKIATCFKLVNQ